MVGTRSETCRLPYRICLTEVLETDTGRCGERKTNAHAAGAPMIDCTDKHIELETLNMTDRRQHTPVKGELLGLGDHDQVWCAPGLRLESSLLKSHPGCKSHQML